MNGIETKKKPELAQIEHELHLCAIRIFDLHHNPDNGLDCADKLALLRAELLIDAALTALPN